MSIIANTTVVSNFACIGQIDLLHRLFGKLYISTEVYAEIQTGLEEGYRFYRDVERYIYPFNESGWIRLVGLVHDEELRYLAQLPSRLHLGEATCIAIAKYHNWLFLTDDQSARRTAVRLGIRLSGTIGCLVLGVERDIWTIDQANTWLQEMIGQGYRSPVRDLAHLVNLP